jgi:hypothetical protein
LTRTQNQPSSDLLPALRLGKGLSVLDLLETALLETDGLDVDEASGIHGREALKTVHRSDLLGVEAAGVTGATKNVGVALICIMRTFPVTSYWEKMMEFSRNSRSGLNNRLSNLLAASGDLDGNTLLELDGELGVLVWGLKGMYSLGPQVLENAGLVRAVYRVLVLAPWCLGVGKRGGCCSRANFSGSFDPGSGRRTRAVAKEQ